MSAVPSRDHRLLRRAVFINFLGLAGKGLWPLLLWLVARWYGAATLGQLTLLQAPLELLLALVSTGFVDGIHRTAARLPGEPLDAAAYAALAVALRSVAALGALVVAASWLAGEALVASLWHRPELARPLLVMSAAVPLAAVTAILVAAATAMMRNEGEALIKGALPPALILLALATEVPFGSLPTPTPAIQPLASAYLLAHAVALVAALLLFTRFASLRALGRAILTAPPPSTAHAVDAASLRRFGLLQGLNMMLWMGVYSLDALLLGAFAGDAQLARYRAGSELARVLQYARTQVSSAFMPLAGRYLRRGEHAELQALLHALPIAMTRGALLLAGLLAWLGAPILHAMLGSSADGAARTTSDLTALANADVSALSTSGLAALAAPPAFLALLLCGHVVVASLSLAGNTLVLAGKQREILRNSALMTATHLALGVPLIAHHGATGTAAATLVAMTVAMLGQLLHLRRALGFTLRWRPLLAAAAIAAACYALSLLLVVGVAGADAIAVASTWPRALLGAALYAALFGAALAIPTALRFRKRPPSRT